MHSLLGPGRHTDTKLPDALILNKCSGPFELCCPKVGASGFCVRGISLAYLDSKRFVAPNAAVDPRAINSEDKRQANGESGRTAC
jgi:hypothetical protein